MELHILLVFIVLLILLIAVHQKHWLWLVLMTFVAVFVSVLKSRENFETMFRDDLNMALNTQESLCKPFENIPNDVRPTLVRNRALHRSKNGDDKCVIRMDDNPLFNDWKCENSAPFYQDDVTTNVQEIYDTDIFNPNTISTSKFCEITFRNDATPDSLVSYATSLEESDPTKQTLTKSIRDLSKRAQNAEQTSQKEREEHAQTMNKLSNAEGDLNSVQRERDSYKYSYDVVARDVNNLRSENSGLIRQTNAENRMSGFTPNNMIHVQSLFHKCLDGGVRENQPAYLWDCAGVPNQRWNMDGKNRLVLNRDKNLCLGPQGNTVGALTPLVAKRCTDEENMKWFYDKETKEIKNHTNPGMCVDVNGWKFDNGQGIIAWHCHGGANQKWGMRQ